MYEHCAYLNLGVGQRVLDVRLVVPRVLHHDRLLAAQRYLRHTDRVCETNARVLCLFALVFILWGQKLTFIWHFTMLCAHIVCRRHRQDICWAYSISVSY